MNWIRKIFYYLYSALEMIVGFKNFPALFPVLLFGKRIPGELIYLRQPPLQFKARGAMDIWAVKETFLDSFYTRYGVPVEDGWIVIDIGAGIGDFCIQSAFGKPRTVVYAYEPFPKSYALLVKNLTLNKIDNVFAFQKAVWSSSGSLMLDLTQGEPLKITSREVGEVNPEGERLTVQALTLEEILIQHENEQVDLVKLDCEGAEYAILMNAAPEALAKVKRIIMETHAVGGHDPGELMVFLESVGYRVHRFANYVHDDLGYLFADRSGGK